MKLGLLLKYEANNYGSKLQALATIKLFEELGHECFVIHYGKKGLKFKLCAVSKLFDASFRQDKWEAYRRKQIYKQNPDIKEYVARRKEEFKKYDKTFFDKYEIYGATYADIQAISKTMDAIVSCSDQLWSPAGLSTNFYNLMFVPDDIKKISFASSFGVAQIPNAQVKRTKEYINRIEFVSCRENRGAEIIKDLTGREVPVLMDPVFAYDINGWKSLVPEKKIVNEPYILSYLLGDNEEHRVIVEKFAKSKGMKIVAIKYLDCIISYDRSFGDICPFDVDPNTMLNLIRNAEYVFTDSFHGTAFSAICQKRFGVFNRYADNSKSSKNSRIDSVCENLHLESRRLYSDSNVNGVMESYIDWVDVQKRINEYGKKMREYLIAALM